MLPIYFVFLVKYIYFYISYLKIEITKRTLCVATDLVFIRIINSVFHHRINELLEVFQMPYFYNLKPSSVAYFRFSTCFFFNIIIAYS